MPLDTGTYLQIMELIKLIMQIRVVADYVAFILKLNVDHPP